ncbi:MAG: hypothetical protein RR651_04850 [Lysinibacillus sp.]
MEDYKISVETVDREIERFKGLVNARQEELDKSLELLKSRTERIDVLKTVEERLQDGPPKVIVQKTYQFEADERFKLIPEVNNHEVNIKHYNNIIEKLEELKRSL